VLLRKIFIKIRRKFFFVLIRIRIILLRKRTITREEGEILLNNLIDRLKLYDIDVQRILQLFSDLMNIDSWAYTTRRRAVRTLCYICHILQAELAVEQLKHLRLLKVVKRGENYEISTREGIVITLSSLALQQDFSDPVLLLIGLLNTLLIFPKALDICIGMMRREEKINVKIVLRLMRKIVNNYNDLIRAVNELDNKDACIYRKKSRISAVVKS